MKPSVRAALCALLALVAPVSAAANPPVPGAGEPVIGLSFRGAHRAYPLTLFSDRRVVNDVIGSMEIAVFHSPELGVSAAWFRTILGEPIEFSGAASGTIADDLTTITRWDLTTGVAVAGNLQGQRLVALPATLTSWEGWTALHPNAGVYAPGQP
jgi:hypothetical protein